MKDCLFVNNTTAKGGDAIYATGSLIAEGIWPWLMAVFDVCWGLKDATNPGKRHFLAFARGKGTPLTLAYNNFGVLPGVTSWCSTLANGFFSVCQGLKDAANPGIQHFRRIARGGFMVFGPG